jgi:predicted ArsR family transcriptional regulator
MGQEASTMAERPSPYGTPTDGTSHWTFLTNHAHVLLCVSGDPSIRVRDIASRVGITERAALRILHDLVQDGHVVAERVGRRNRYRLLTTQPMRHPMEQGIPVRALVEAFRHGGGEPAGS